MGLYPACRFPALMGRVSHQQYDEYFLSAVKGCSAVLRLLKPVLSERLCLGLVNSVGDGSVRLHISMLCVPDLRGDMIC